MMRPWIAVAYSAPVAAATAVFIIYPIGQGSFSDGMPLGEPFCPFILQNMNITLLKREIYSLAYSLYNSVLNNKTIFLLHNFYRTTGKNYEDLSGESTLEEPRPTFEEPSNEDNVFDEKAKPFEQEFEEQGFRKQPGVYKITCTQNKKVYIGEGSNLTGRMANHKYHLRKGDILYKEELQNDWNTFGEGAFTFQVCFMGPDWDSQEARRQKEAELIELVEPSLRYNKYADIDKRGSENNPFFGRQHSESAKAAMSVARKGVPLDALGRPVYIEGTVYPSQAAAAKALDCSRRKIQGRIKSSNFPEWQNVDEMEK